MGQTGTVGQTDRQQRRLMPPLWCQRHNKLTPMTSVLRSLHWLRITERIEYKLLSLTYKVLTTTQPPYFHKLISTQRPRSTRSSSVVTLTLPPSSSSLKFTDRSFRYALPLSVASSTSFWYQFLHFRLSYSYNRCSLTHHFFLFQFSTLLIHNSLSLSLPA